MRRTPISRRMSSTRRASTNRMASVRPILEERSCGVCDVCGRPLTPTADGYLFQAHHRLSRARGGGDDASNLMAVCGPEGNDCHALIHSRVARSTDNGWILPSGSDPAKSSLIFRHYSTFLTDDGEILEVSEYVDRCYSDDYRDSLLDEIMEAGA